VPPAGAAMASLEGGNLPGLRADAQKAVKIAYALRFANLADFVSALRLGKLGLQRGSPLQAHHAVRAGYASRLDDQGFRGC
jgi:hypothetical protein